MREKSQNLKRTPKTSKESSVSPKNNHVNPSFENPMEMVTDPFYILDVDHYSFLYANKAARKYKAIHKKTCHEHFFNRKKPVLWMNSFAPFVRFFQLKNR